MFMFNNYKLMQFILSFFGLVALTFFVAINFIYFYPVSIVTIKCPIEVTTKDVVPGSVITYRMNYDKYYNVPEIISQQLVVGGHTIAAYELSKGHLSKDESFINMHLLIPPDSPPGQAKITILLRYTIFYGLRVVDVSRQTDPFTITTRQ